MEFTTPLGLLALLSLPVVLALHFFRRKLREQRVSGLFLFQKDALPADAGRQRSRLLQTPSLYLELLAALLVSLWLSGFSVGLSDHRSHVIVVPTRASLRSIPHHQNQRFPAAAHSHRPMGRFL